MVLGQPHLNIPYSPTQAVSSSRSSLFKTIVDFFPRIRRRRDKQEGIIVTHTPSPSAPSTPYAATFSVPIGPGSSLPLSPHSLSTDSLHPRSSEEIMSRNRRRYSRSESQKSGRFHKGIGYESKKSDAYNSPSPSTAVKAKKREGEKKKSSRPVKLSPTSRSVLPTRTRTRMSIIASCSASSSFLLVNPSCYPRAGRS